MDPYLVLLQVGFTLPPTVATGAVRSYRTISPLPTRSDFIGGIFSVALSVGLHRPGVTWHLALWSPDFPPALFIMPATRLTGSSVLTITAQTVLDQVTWA